jgi:hypothetical protein
MAHNIGATSGLTNGAALQKRPRSQRLSFTPKIGILCALLVKSIDTIFH